MPERALPPAFFKINTFIEGDNTLKTFNDGKYLIVQVPQPVLKTLSKDPLKIPERFLWLFTQGCFPTPGGTLLIFSQKS